MITFYLFKRKWIPIPAFSVFLLSSLQREDVWYDNSNVKIQVGGDAQVFYLPLVLLSLHPQTRNEGRKGCCLNTKREHLGVSFPRQCCLVRSPSPRLSELQREWCVLGEGTDQRGSFTGYSLWVLASLPVPSQRQLELSKGNSTAFYLSYRK